MRPYSSDTLNFLDLVLLHTSCDQIIRKFLVLKLITSHNLAIL